MSNKSTHMIPNGSPFLHSSDVVGLNGTEISSLLHHHPDLFRSHYFSANAPHYFEAYSHLLNQDVGCGLNGGYQSVITNTVGRKQSVARKDRHSKIYTSQGPRDRRVRLSIGIARKFFDLQEMLGFDKPSKTLDWLLTKSKPAIEDLGQKKNQLREDSDKKFNGVLDDPQNVAAANLVKESRAKARARARERTREKMCIKQLNGLAKNSEFPTIPNHSRHDIDVLVVPRDVNTNHNMLSIG